MLKNTFRHLYGIGQRTEELLWKQGIRKWEDVFSQGQLRSVPTRARRPLMQGIPASMKALKTRNVHYFTARLPASELWRIWAAFRERACFLDIETTGLPPGTVHTTVACLSDWKRIRLFVRHKNLDKLPAALDRYDLVVTFNGKCFDLPILRKEFPTWRSEPGHLDLRYPLRRVGLSGGLKAIMRSLRISTPRGLSGIEGWMAPLLWREYEKGHKNALETLKAYAINDVVHLPWLADCVYNAMTECVPFRIPALHLVRPLRNSHRPDAKLVRELRSWYEDWHW